MWTSPTCLRPLAAAGLAGFGCHTSLSGEPLRQRQQQPAASARPSFSRQVRAVLAESVPVARPRGLLRCDTVVGDLHCEFCGQPASGNYTPVFDAAARRSTAAVNTNGNLLRSYARSMGNVGRKEDVYDRLYACMLKEAQQAPGQLRSASDCSAAIPAAVDLGLAGCFARVPETWDSSWGAASAVFIDVYQTQTRPLNKSNVALIYIESPNARGAVAGASLLGGFLSCIGDRTQFLHVLESTAANLMHAVLEYNAIAHEGGKFPRIQVLQCCLVSGGPFRHPETTKVEVAAAIVRGLSSAASSAPAEELRPDVRFAYDEEQVFQAAVAAVNKAPS